jgi:hypothetical protein
MRRSLFTAVAAVAAVLAPAAPAAAGGGPGVNPAAYCDANHYTFLTWDLRERDAYWIPLVSAGQQGLYRFPIESFEGCVSTVAAGMHDGFVPSADISLPAARAQCAYLEAELGLTYPAVMRGTTVRNRTGCAQYLQVALTQMPPPADGPPVHGG